MAGTLCASMAVVHKAGEGVNSTTIASAAIIDEFIEQAEGYLSVATRYDWVTNHGSLTTPIKEVLKEACSDLAAVYAIQYDMFGYSSIEEAQTMINILLTRFENCVELIIDSKTKEAYEV